jgi:NADPH-dependent glutamate synthase beta subunit-like oxidoreductase
MCISHFKIAKGVNFKSINYITEIKLNENMIVVGAGKTGMDCIIYLLNKGISPN